jgi:hypothetical protein
VVTRERWAPAFRAIATRYPNVSVYDRIADASNFTLLLEIEARTNPRVRAEAGDLSRVRASDIVSGPGTTPVMSSFIYASPGRFNDSSFGVYYAASDEPTMIEESIFHTEWFLRQTSEPSTDVDKRVYTAAIEGTFDDLRSRRRSSPLYDPDPANYAGPQAYARRLYDRNRVDGILYRSVRHAAGTCVAAFRPRIVTNCRIAKYLQFRWDGTRITGVTELTNILLRTQ